jgi:hypothetical protein
MLHRVFALLRGLLLKTPAKIAAGLLTAYFLFAWFGFEPLLKWAAPKFIADKSQHRLSIAAARFDPFALSLSIKGLKLAEPDGKPLLAFGELFIDFDAISLLKRAYVFDDIRLSAPDAQLELRPDGSLNWLALIEALKSKEEEDSPLPRLLIRRISLEKGALAFADRKVGFETRLNPLDLTLTDISTLPDDKGAYSLAATTQLGARIRWKGDVTLKPIQANGELAIDQVTLARLWPYVQNKFALQAPAGTASLALNYRVGYANKKLSLLLDKLGFNLDGLALQGLQAKQPAIRLDKLAMTGGRFDLEKRELNIGEIALNGGSIALNRDTTGRLDIQDWFAAPANATVKPVTSTQTSAAQPAPWRVNLNRCALNSLGIQLTDAGFATPLKAEIGNVRLGFAAKAEAGGAQTQVVVEDLGIDVSGIRLLSGTTPLFVLGGITLNEGHIDLAARQANVGKISLSNGKVDAVRDARGRIALLEAFKLAPGKPATVPAPAATEPAWRYQVSQIGLAGFQIAARDESVQPAAALTLENIEASVSGFSENLKTPLPIRLGFQIKQGGSFQADGKVVPATPSADVKLKLGNLALLPAQPYLAQAANLVLASGRVSTQGQLRFDGKGGGKSGGKADAPPKVTFRGGFEVADLLLNERETGARFLAWKRLGSDSVNASQSALDIEELRVDSLDAKLIIYKDKSVNLKRILKTADAPVDQTAAAPAKVTESKGRAGQDEPAFRMAIDRIRIDQGELDFADYSLALPFGTRIHDLKGAFNGISSKPGTLAELEIDGQVDEFGLARAVGQVDLFNPTGFMDIKTVFRNVEMNSLTPYTATFVGRKIESGKLSLDLEYKIKARQLLGENKIVMDKLTLGERVQSPTAKDLPLDLAIAILQDSDGRIDLGLPVSGSLDDPQFSYGQIIWKAIGNIITKIVTAPFRALGALFGGGGEKLEKVAFEAGEDTLTPPEREKLKQISQILNKRPGLALSIHGASAAAVDRPVMKETQLRRAVAEKMGLKLAPDEDPGPTSTANPKSQAALEALYAQRFGEPEWQALNSKWRQANPDKKQETGTGKMLSRLKGLFKTEQPLSAEDAAQLKNADLHALLYQRLLDKEAVSDEALHKLAARRGEAVAKGLAAAGAPSERIKLSESAASEADGREVPVKLELGVARR